MVVPYQHTSTLTTLSTEELDEMMRLHCAL